MGFFQRLRPRSYLWACLPVLLIALLLGYPGMSRQPTPPLAPEEIQEARGQLESLTIANAEKRELELRMTPASEPPAFIFNAAPWILMRNAFRDWPVEAGDPTVVRFYERDGRLSVLGVTVGEETLVRFDQQMARLDREQARQLRHIATSEALFFAGLGLAIILIAVATLAWRSRRRLEPRPEPDFALNGGLVMWLLMAGVVGAMTLGSKASIHADYGPSLLGAPTQAIAALIAILAFAPAAPCAIGLVTVIRAASKPEGMEDLAFHLIPFGGIAKPFMMIFAAIGSSDPALARQGARALGLFGFVGLYLVAWFAAI